MPDGLTMFVFPVGMRVLVLSISGKVTMTGTVTGYGEHVTTIRDFDEHGHGEEVEGYDLVRVMVDGEAEEREINANAMMREARPSVLEAISAAVGVKVDEDSDYEITPHMTFWARVGDRKVRGTWDYTDRTGYSARVPNDKE